MIVSSNDIRNNANKLKVGESLIYYCLPAVLGVQNFAMRDLTCDVKDEAFITNDFMPVAVALKRVDTERLYCVTLSLHASGNLFDNSEGVLKTEKDVEEFLNTETYAVPYRTLNEIDELNDTHYVYYDSYIEACRLSIGLIKRANDIAYAMKRNLRETQSFIDSLARTNPEFTLATL